MKIGCCKIFNLSISHCSFINDCHKGIHTHTNNRHAQKFEVAKICMANIIDNLISLTWPFINSAIVAMMLCLHALIMNKNGRCHKELSWMSRMINVADIRLWWHHRGLGERLNESHQLYPMAGLEQYYYILMYHRVQLEFNIW